MSVSHEDWLRYAGEDLAMARVLIGTSVPPRGSAFHAQQAVEKALKAVLVANGREVPRIHDLLSLIHRLPPVAGLPATADLDVLSDYAVDSRYPDDMPDVTADEAHEAIEIAEAVLAAVRAALGA